jgi:hypothetical protein
MDRLDLSDPYDPQLLPPVNVPGVVIDADLAQGRIVTEDLQWRADDTLERSLNVCQLYGNIAMLRDRQVLPDDASRVLVDGDRALFALNKWWYDEQEERYHAESSFQAVDLSNPDSLRLTAEVPLEVPYTGVYEIVGDKVILGTWWYLTGLMVYDISDLDYPVFTQHVRTQGWISDMVSHATNLYVATGPYGVKTIPLDTPNPILNPVTKRR